MQPAESWQDHARRAALEMRQGRIPRSRGTTGKLDSILRRIPRERQAEAADELRRWAVRYFPDEPKSPDQRKRKDYARTIADELIGTRVINIVAPGVAGRATAGRRVAPGIDSAVAAMRLRVSAGVPKKTAAREVSDEIKTFLGRQKLSTRDAINATIAIDGQNLERTLYDAYLRHTPK